MAASEAPRTERELFDDLQSLCTSPGYAHALALVAFRDNVIAYRGPMTERVVAASHDGERTIRAECATLLGLLLKGRVDFARPSPERLRAMVERTYALLSELHACLGRPMRDAIVDAARRGQTGRDLDPDEVLGRGDVLREAIFYAAESAYSFQYASFAPLKYGRDDAWLRERMGFGVAEAHAVATAAGGLTGRRLAALAAGTSGRAERDWDVLAGFVLSVGEVAAASDLEPATARAVLEAFAAPAGPCNAAFASLGDFNVATARPLLRVDPDRYACLQAYCLLEALYESPFFWMAADAGYRDVASANRGAFTEELVASRLEAVFGAANVHRGVTILRGSRRVTEVDVLVTFADRALVVQCKSKRLTVEARKGNDLRLRDDFGKAVQQAYDQALASAEALRDPSLRLVLGGGRDVRVAPPRLAYPICVVSDVYPALAAQVRQFLRTSTSEGVRPPLATDVFAIDAMAEMLDVPLRFLSYLDRRVELGDRVSANGELAILGHHLSSNLWLDPGHAMAMIADGCAAGLDAAMAVRRDGLVGRRTPRGVLDRFGTGSIGRLLSVVERSAEPALLDLGLLLLTMSGSALSEFERHLERSARRARGDGRTHDFTMGLGDGSAGLTVHCVPSRTDAAMEVLGRHCACRKYVQRAGEWFGLLVRSRDATLEDALVLRAPWRRDAGLDAATADMADLAQGAAGRGRASGGGPKAGRNDPCPCGSGLKHKRCCPRRTRARPRPVSVGPAG